MLERPFALQRGGVLERLTLAYDTLGTRTDDAGNIVLVLHALTGNTDVARWWPDVVSADGPIDPSRDFVLVPNLLGSCYGSTGPASIDPATGAAYGDAFPEITVRDTARAVLALLDTLEITRVQLAIGGSSGGMVALELLALAPERFARAVVISAAADHGAWRLGFSTVIRTIIETCALACGPDDGARLGLRLARQVAMLAYRAPAGIDARFGRRLSSRPGEEGTFAVASWLAYHGRAITTRFSPACYRTLTRAMEWHDLAADRGARSDVLRAIATPVLIVGATTDVLYPEEELRQLARSLGNAEYVSLESVHGHDAFLIDTRALAALISPFVAAGRAAHASAAEVTR